MNAVVFEPYAGIAPRAALATDAPQGAVGEGEKVPSKTRRPATQITACKEAGEPCPMVSRGRGAYRSSGRGAGRHLRRCGRASFRVATLRRVRPRRRAPLQTVDVDAFAALCRCLISGMMGRRFGRIVAVTSLAAMVGGPGAAPYAQAKVAVEGLVRGLATGLGRFSITVNAVAPGFVQTSRLAARSGDGSRDLARKTAVGRLASPEDGAGPVAFLCGQRAAFVTGHTLVVDGGLHLANAW